MQGFSLKFAIIKKTEWNFIISIFVNIKFKKSVLKTDKTNCLISIGWKHFEKYLSSKNKIHAW